ncbi:MAG: hypothetical protein SFU85_08760 [Candidatus Methylacidiphilales bacterium]|nr:hypothetical protein [Candidatus Methylacidiphilales bacterium]
MTVKWSQGNPYGHLNLLRVPRVVKGVMAIPWTPHQFVSLPFSTERPDYAFLTQAPGIKTPVTRKTVTRGHIGKMERKDATMKACEDWRNQLFEHHGKWAVPFLLLDRKTDNYLKSQRPTAWDSWELFFSNLGADKVLGDYAAALDPLRTAVRVVGAIPSAAPGQESTNVDQETRRVWAFLNQSDPILDLVDGQRMARLVDPSLGEFQRWNAASTIESTLDFPMIRLGCLAACVESPSFVKASGFGVVMPVGKMLEMAAKKPQSGMFWKAWARFAQATFGAESQRQWAQMLAGGDEGEARDDDVDPFEAWLGNVNRWHRGRSVPSAKLVSKAFERHPFHRQWKRAQAARARVAWLGLALLAFNLELTLRQYAGIYRIEVGSPGKAFALAHRSYRFFRGEQGPRRRAPR